MAIYAKEYLHSLIRIVTSKIPRYTINLMKQWMTQLNKQITVRSLPELRNLMDDQELNQYLKKVISISFNANKKYFQRSRTMDIKRKEILKANEYNCTI